MQRPMKHLSAWALRSFTLAVPFADNAVWLRLSLPITQPRVACRVLLATAVLVASLASPCHADSEKKKSSKRAKTPAVHSTRDSERSTSTSVPTNPPTGENRDGDATRLEKAAASGAVEIDLSDILGKPLSGRVDFFDTAGNPPVAVEVPEGKTETTLPSGTYRAYVYVYDNQVPVLIDIQQIEAKPGGTAFVLVSLVEGSSGGLPLRAFDNDGDLALDRVELSAGTDPYNAASIPGKPTLSWDSPVLEDKAGWYRGELCAYSRYGKGTEDVEALIKRAEKAKLDFLAITDRGTLAAASDPKFTSKSVVLIPAMTWGNDELGEALIYAPRTMPDPPSTLMGAQAECIRVQAQGGIFAIAHPCLPTNPWQWGVGYVNAVQVWFRDWRDMPPLALTHLRKELHERKDGRLVHSIAAAAQAIEVGDISGNAQATLFYDYELLRGLMACVIGGSGSGSPKIPLGKPVTYVYAKNKSLAGILEGLRLGRTYVSSGTDGPRLYFNADILKDGKIDVGIGGVVPLGIEVRFEVGVIGAEGKKLQVLLNGYPILSKIIEGPAFVHRFDQLPKEYSVYRVAVTAPAASTKKGFGPTEVYALSSPIYAQDLTDELVWRNPKIKPEDAWIRIKPDTTPEVALPEDVPPLNAQP